jgi:urea carboxylase-associated protein 2
MPTVPATAATDLPDGVDAAAVVWDELLGPGSYATRVVARGTVVRLADLEGDACAHVLVLDAHAPHDRLNVADTVKVQWQAYLGSGALLLSGQGRVLATIVADTSGRHDALCGTSTAAGNAARYGDGGAHGPSPSGRDRFLVALAKHGLGPRDLPPTISFFQSVRVAPDGGLDLVGALGAPAHVDLRAEVDLVVVVVSAPHPLDERPTYSTSPLRVTAWRGEPTGPDDPHRRATPEARRAFENTDEALRARGVLP